MLEKSVDSSTFVDDSCKLIAVEANTDIDGDRNMLDSVAVVA